MVLSPPEPFSSILLLHGGLQADSTVRDIFLGGKFLLRLTPGLHLPLPLARDSWGKLQFHVSMWKKFEQVFLVTQQRNLTGKSRPFPEDTGGHIGCGRAGNRAVRVSAAA